MILMLLGKDPAGKQGFAAYWTVCQYLTHPFWVPSGCHVCTVLEGWWVRLAARIQGTPEFAYGTQSIP